MPSPALIVITKIDQRGVKTQFTVSRPLRLKNKGLYYLGAARRRMGSRTERLVLDGRRESRVAQWKRPSTHLSATSLTHDEVSELYDKVKPVALRQAYRRFHKHGRKRKYGAGRTHEYGLRDRLVMALMQLRGKSEEDVALAFDVAHDTARAALAELLPILYMVIDIPRRLARRVSRQRRDRPLDDYLDLEMGVMDAMVINTTKPRDRDVLKAYSRRKKGVGRNVQTTLDGGGYIIDATRPVRAAINDAALFHLSRNGRLLRAVKKWFTDRGYYHVEKAPDITIIHGDKKPPGGELSEESLKKNSYINSQKYYVEQTNAHIQNYHILDKLHWFEADRMDMIIQVVCGLINFRKRRRRDNPVDWGHRNRVPCERVPRPEGCDY